MEKTAADATEANTGIDWRQWCWPGPKRVFTEAELARAGQQPWPKGLDMYLAGSFIMFPLLSHRLVSGWLAGVLVAATAVIIAGALQFAHALWKRPDSNRLNRVGYAVMAVPAFALLVVAGTRMLPKAEMLRMLPGVTLLLVLITLVYFGWLVIVVLRSQQIEARLKELDEQDRGIRLARRLATAQIQPHFLFNTLASVQHWVDTRDERAGPTLKSFTRYLRATLPMFERETLTLAEELQIVRSYLEVMQARLGERLAWQIEAPAEAALSLPPGALLTLVENAIAHGIEPALRGGRIEVSVRSEAPGQWILDVSNDGAELDPGACDGLGLSNTRERLAQQFGDKAVLTLQALTPGCRARIEIQTP